jgi:hypothetical protein
VSKKDEAHAQNGTDHARLNASEKHSRSVLGNEEESVVLVVVSRIARAKRSKHAQRAHGRRP